LFLDNDAMAAAVVTTQDVAGALHGAVRPDGSQVFADVFPSFAVRFGEYC
jgi:hypothetical protein